MGKRHKVESKKDGTLSEAKAKNVNVRKWGRTLMEAGFTIIPNVFLSHQKKLGLESEDLIIILQIAKHWWTKEHLPYPSMAGLAADIGCSKRTVQRRIVALYKKKFLTKVPRKNVLGGDGNNAYSFDGLMDAARPYARELVQLKADKARDARARKRRGLKPKKS